MSETVTPALTPEEWAAKGISAPWWSLGIGHRGKIGFGATDAGGDMTTQQRHGVAALCLYGQPFGFTHEDVDALRTLADEFEQEAKMSEAEHFVGAGARSDDGGIWRKNAESCRRRGAELARIADRITALLPPKHFPPTP